MECNNTITRVMFIILFSVILLAGPTYGRKGPIEYWVEVMKDQPIPEAFKGLLGQRPNEINVKEEQTEGISKNFNPIPNISAYHDDVTKKETSSQKEDCDSHHDGLSSKKVSVHGFESRPTTTAYAEFEPRPSLTAYVEFEPQPTISAYKELESKPTVTAYKNFEPRPTISAYKELESRPTITAYNDFEPRPSMTGYVEFEPRPSMTGYVEFEPRPTISAYKELESRSTVTAYNDFEPKPTITAYKD